MRPEVTCADVHEEISARLDGELGAPEARLLDEHLASCSECRRYEWALAEARRSLRARPAEAVPDLTERIMQRVRPEAPRVLRRREWRARIRVASIAAAASALLLFGASLPFGDRTAGVASASEIVRQVRAAARMLTSYRADYEIVERNWHPEVPVRRFDARVAFRAPERFSLSILDRTTYPGRVWPHNDVDLVSNGNRWWIEEMSTCPVEALPGCSTGGPKRRAIVSRQPFDGASQLPTDIVVPLQTIGGSVGLEVLGERMVAERRAYRVELPFLQAAPLISSLQTGGSWRSFHPLDPVTIDLDAATWFPLGFRVTAGDSPERAAWAQRSGYRDRPGSTLLRVTSTGFSEETHGSFRVPTAGIVKDGGFADESRPFGPEPAYLAKLQPDRDGRAGEVSIRTFVRGLTWLKVVNERSGSIAAVRFFASEEVQLPGGGIGYYAPSSLRSPRRVDLFGTNGHVSLESNLPRAELLRVATSIPVETRPLPRTTRLAGGLVLERLEPNRVELPEHVPAGYRLVSAFRSVSADGRVTITSYLSRAESEYDGFGIRIVETEPARRLAPSAEQFVEVTVGNVRGRWSAERAELEWIDNGTYRAIAAPSIDLATVLQIARDL